MSILSWYTGKSLAGAQEALDLVSASEQQEFWLPGASRRAYSLLGKANVAIKAADPVMRSNTYDHPAYRAIFAMKFGGVKDAPKLLATTPSPSSVSEADRPLTATARRWCEDFAPLARRMAELDARRPKPVIVCGTLSRAVVDNVAAKLGLVLDSIEVPPQTGEWVSEERPVKDRPGKTEIVKVFRVTIHWPPGTRHRRSKFSYGSRAGNNQCEACGHAIKDPYNWCPLMAREADGSYSSLWVGKDCAKKLLGCKVDSGEAIYTGRV